MPSAHKSALAAFAAALLCLAACSPKGPSDEEAAASSQAALDGEMAQAFTTAFGAPAPAPHDVQRSGQTVSLQYTPQKLTDLGGGRLALVSTAVWPNGCPTCGGAVAVHYLTYDGTAFHVTGAWYDLGPSGSFGDAPDARIRQGLFDNPAVEADVPRRDTGCEMIDVSLYELTPSGPALRAKDILTQRTNIPMGAMRTNALADYYGNVIPDKKGKTFKVHYHGTTEGDVTYRPGPGGVWTGDGAIKLPPC